MWEIPGSYKGDRVKTVSKEGSDVYYRHGQGIYRYPNSIYRYSGSWRQNVKHGKGHLMLGKSIHTQTFYEGEFNLGEMTGNGTRKWHDGSTYTGSFQNGLKHGKGELSSPEYRYSGDFCKNRKEGKGVIHWRSGDVYQGDFVKDHPSGEGIFVNANRTLVYKGDFKRLEKWRVTCEGLPVYDKYPAPFVTPRHVMELKKDDYFIVLEWKDVWARHKDGWSSIYDGEFALRGALVIRKGLRFGNGKETIYPQNPDTKTENPISTPKGIDLILPAEDIKPIEDYRGQFFEGLRHGQGLWVHYPTGYRYEGPFCRGKPLVESWLLRLYQWIPIVSESEGKSTDRKNRRSARASTPPGKKSEIKNSTGKKPAGGEGWRVNSGVEEKKKSELVGSVSYVLPGEVLKEIEMKVCSYDGSINSYETGRAFSLSLNCLKDSSAPKEQTTPPVMVFGFSDPSQELLKSLPVIFTEALNRDIANLAIQEIENMKPPSVVEHSLEIRPRIGLVIRKAPELRIDPKLSKKKKKKKKAVRRRRKKKEEEIVVETGPPKIPPFTSLRGYQSEAGSLKLPRLAFHEGLKPGTDIEIVASDITDGMVPEMRVGGGKKFRFLFRVVDKKTKAKMLGRKNK
ncbi:hypothetical protein AAMO2058_001145400 [Amorphochlora amoebiformis]